MKQMKKRKKCGREKTTYKPVRALCVKFERRKPPEKENKMNNNEKK